MRSGGAATRAGWCRTGQTGHGHCRDGCDAMQNNCWNSSWVTWIKEKTLLWLWAAIIFTFYLTFGLKEMWTFPLRIQENMPDHTQPSFK